MNAKSAAALSRRGVHRIYVYHDEAHGNDLTRVGLSASPGQEGRPKIAWVPCYCRPCYLRAKWSCDSMTVLVAVGCCCRCFCCRYGMMSQTKSETELVYKGTCRSRLGLRFVFNCVRAHLTLCPVACEILAKCYWAPITILQFSFSSIPSSPLLCHRS